LRRNITVTTPGKLMLFGEHAVVYGHPCLVTAVDRRMKVKVEVIDSPEFHLNAEDVGVSNYKKPMSMLGKGEIPREVKFVEFAVKNIINDKMSGIKITTKSEFSSKFGFGSSAAVTVCVIKALAELTGNNLSQNELFDLSYLTVLEVQGKGSGFDAASAVYGGTLYFVTGGKTIEPLVISNLPLIVGYSGIKADTVTLMNQVKTSFANKQDHLNEIYRSIEVLVKAAKDNLVKKDWGKCGDLMNKNQAYLSEIGVSSEKLDKMITAAREAGAYGAKLSGAGGGDCMIAISPAENEAKVNETITKVGGQLIRVETNAEGVRVEKND